MSTSKVLQFEQTKAENNETQKALTLFTKNYYLMLSSLPQLNGLEVAKFIRVLKSGAPIPIIVLTIHDFSIKTDCLAIGVNEIFSKLATQDTLQKILTAWLKI